MSVSVCSSGQAMPLIVHAPSSAVALSSPAALVGSRDGIDVGVDVGRFAAVVGSRDGIDVGVDVGRFVAVVGSPDGIDVGVDVGTFVGAGLDRGEQQA